MNIDLHLFAAIGELARLKDVFSSIISSDDKALLRHLVNKRNDKTKTILHIACDCGHEDVVRYLISLGRDVLEINEVNKGGNTALAFASMAGASDVVRLLLNTDLSGDFEVEVYRKNNEGNNAMFIAAQSGHDCVVHELLYYERRKNHNGNSYVLSPCGKFHVSISHSEYLDEANKDGFTPLLAAAQMGHENVLSFLIANGATDEICTAKGNNALHLAAMGGHMKIVCTLATYDNIRNSYNRDGISPLMFAVYNDYLNIAVHLLENEASFDDLLVNVDQKKLNRSSRERKLCVSSSCLQRCEKLLMYASQHGPRYSRVIEGLINHIDGLDIYKEVRFLSTSEEDEHDDRAYRFSTRAAVYSRSSPFSCYGDRCDDDHPVHLLQAGLDNMVRCFKLKLNWLRRRSYCSFVRGLQGSVDKAGNDVGASVKDEGDDDGKGDGRVALRKVFTIDVLCTGIAAFI